MAAVDDILRSYRSPRQVLRGHLARSRSEPRLFSFLVAALIVMFVAQWPRLSREAFLNEGVPLAGLMLGTGLAMAAMIPVFYLLAGLATLLMRPLGGRGDWYGGRLALFWALLAAAPLVLLQGLTAGFIGPGIQLTVVSVLVSLVFVLIWGAGLKVSQFEAVP